jgi:hypothetical protein
MTRSVIQYLDEGEKLDKVKEHLKKHWVNYVLGATTAGLIGTKYYLKGKTGTKIVIPTPNSKTNNYLPGEWDKNIINKRKK